MTSRCRALRAGALVLATASLSGCTQILGSDEYGFRNPIQGKHDAGSSGIVRDAGTLFDPKPPFLTGTACDNCMQANCAVELAACDADPVCSRYVETARTEEGPYAAFQRDFLPPLADAEWARDHDGAPDTLKVLDDLTAVRPGEFGKDCSRACTEPCELGRDFSCVGAYDWPRKEAGAQVLRFWLTDGPAPTGWAGWEIKVCPNYMCDAPWGTAVTDLNGFAQLTFDRTYFTPAEPVLFVNGSLVDGGLDAYPVIFPQAAPFVSGSYLRVPIVDKATVDGAYRMFGGTFNSDLGDIWVIPWDCRGQNAKHVTLDVLTFGDQGYERCTGCDFRYTADTGLIDPSQSDFSSLGDVAFVTGVAPRNTLVILRDTESGRAVAVQKLSVQAGHVHAFFLYPASKAELAAIPSELR